MKTRSIDVVADDLIIGQLEHEESCFVDWKAMSQKARHMAMELHPGHRKLQLRAKGVCLLDLTRQGKHTDDAAEDEQ